MNERLDKAVREFLAGEVKRGEMPGASWLIRVQGEDVSVGATGHSVVDPERLETRTDTIFDLASLTKPLITAALAFKAQDEERINLGEPIARFVPELNQREEKQDITFADLLAHRAGFEAWYPMYVHGSDRESYLSTILARPLAYQPRSGVVYTDLGFILLLIALERVFESPLDEVAREKLFEPLGVVDAFFGRVPADLKSRVAATEYGNLKEREMVRELSLEFRGFRDRMLWGEVNDGNSWHMGGFAGNAGLFGTADVVATLASAWVGGSVLSEEARSTVSTCQAESADDRRGFGWQLKRDGGPAESLSAGSFGHTGFTGVSCWVDKERKTTAVLLTNRIHPRVAPSRIQEIRRQFHQIIATTCS